MKASASHVVLFCLLLGAFATVVATKSSCSEDPGCAVPIEDDFPDDNQALSLLQLDTEHNLGTRNLNTEAAQAAARSEAAQTAAPANDFEMKKCVAEFIAMTLFVFIGCGSAMSMAKQEGSAWILQVSLTFGIAITVLAYTIGHYSGGHINCAVTFGLVLTGNCSVRQGLGNLVAQLLGSVLGASILSVAYSKLATPSLDKTGGLGTNAVGDNVPITSALIMEIAGTFLLMYVVLETATNKANNVGNMAPLAIGFAVFLAHSVLISIDGCSINPTRTTGPAIVNAMMNSFSEKAMTPIKQLWVFWVGPLVGAALAAAVYTGLTA